MQDNSNVLFPIDEHSDYEGDLNLLVQARGCDRFCKLVLELIQLSVILQKRHHIASPAELHLFGCICDSRSCHKMVLPLIRYFPAPETSPDPRVNQLKSVSQHRERSPEIGCLA